MFYFHLFVHVASVCCTGSVTDRPVPIDFQVYIPQTMLPYKALMNSGDLS